jgi:hypothetical protein
MDKVTLLAWIGRFGIIGLSCCIVPTGAATENFDAGKPGDPPAGWQCGSTGGGSPRWSIEPDSPGRRPVLKQSGSGRFPWCVKTGSSATNGWVEVKFKALAGKEDQAGGLVWRWKNGDNYYVARANALENNVSLYYTKDGSRRTIKYVDAPVPANVWHVLRVEFKDSKIRVALNGKVYIEEDDSHIVGAGKVGVWTKADSVTVFDAFAFEGSGG